MQREFNIVDEWLYYKIYCGVKTADIILLEHLNKKIKFLKENKIIKKWFFIRYNDPENHIRLRFLLFKNSSINEVIKILQQTFEELQSQNIIWKIQVDTYVREIERYGASTYEFTEKIFEADSELMLDYLKLKGQFSNENTSLLFSFYAIDSFLNLFKLSNQEKFNLLNSMQLSFKQEYNADKILKKEFDIHYRELSNKIELILKRKNEDEYFYLFEIIDCKTNKIKDDIPIIVDNLEVDISSYLNSQIHMMINRQYTSRQREYELIIYDYMYRYYKKQIYFFNSLQK